jgi:hypothetical protein
VSVAAAVALLGVLAGFFLWSVNRGTKRTVSPEEVAVAPAEAMQKPAEVAPAEPPRAPAVEPPADEAEATAAVEPVAPARGDEPVQEGSPVTSVGAARAPIATVDGLPGTTAAEPSPPAVAASEPPPAATMPPDAAAAPPPGDQRVPSGDALAIVAAPAVAEPAAASIPAAAADAPPADGAAGQGIGSAAKVRDGGLLLHRGEVDGAAAWLLVPTDAPLTDREDLLAPPWCHPVFSLGGITIRLEPGSRVVVTHDADGTPRVEVVFGRAIVSGEAADARVGVMAGGLHGVVSGMMRQPAGIEVLLDRAPGSASTPSRRAVIHAGATEKVWQQVAADGGLPLLVGLRACLKRRNG